jgi:hypothetical protein
MVNFPCTAGWGRLLRMLTSAAAAAAGIYLVVSSTRKLVSAATTTSAASAAATVDVCCMHVCAYMRMWHVCMLLSAAALGQFVKAVAANCSSCLCRVPRRRCRLSNTHKPHPHVRTHARACKVGAGTASPSAEQLDPHTKWGAGTGKLHANWLPIYMVKHFDILWLYAGPVKSSCWAGLTQPSSERAIRLWFPGVDIQGVQWVVPA